MRRLAAFTLSLSLMAGPALARTSRVVDPCTRDADRTAFDTEGLKSELMVTALACKQQDKYNSFMRAYQPSVAAEEHDLTAYFKRVYGRGYTKAYDEYISNLANVQSQDSLKSGTAFCAEFQDMFDEVMSLHDGSELAEFANSQAIAQPIAFTTCSAAPAKALAPKGRHRAKHRSA